MHNGASRAILPEERGGSSIVQHGTRPQLFRHHLRLLHCKLQAAIVRDTQHERITQACLLRLDTLAALAANFPQCCSGQI